ncbi:MAG: hypothetical protein AAF493_13865 [Pseudomonadota bacterium]
MNAIVQSSHRLLKPLLMIAMIGIAVVPSGRSMPTAGLHGQVEALASSYGFDVVGLDLLTNADEKAVTGTLTERLNALLVDYDYAIELEQGVVDRVVIVGLQSNDPIASTPASGTPSSEPAFGLNLNQPLNATGLAALGSGTPPSSHRPRISRTSHSGPPGGATPASTRCDADLTGHFDVFLAIDPPTAAGGEILVDIENDFCEEFTTGDLVIFGDFNDFGGGPFFTDDPGWFMDPGNMIDGESLHYRALGALRFWDNTAKAWINTVPNGERVRLFGGAPLEIVLTGDRDLIESFEGGTVWTTAGLEGPIEAGVDLADSVGGIHTHLDFCVEDGTGDCSERVFGAPSPGAYLIRLQLTSPENVGTSAKYVDSGPILVALRHDLSTADFQEALDALTEAPTPAGNQPALPAAGILILSGG